MTLTIYGMQTCPACMWAKQTLSRNKTPFKYVELGVDLPHIEFRQAFPEVTRLPAIYEGSNLLDWGQFIAQYTTGNQNNAS